VMLSGCASVSTFSAIPVEGTHSSYSNGAPLVVSEKRWTRVALGPSGAAQDASQRQVFSITIENGGPEAFDVGPESVTVTTDQGKMLAVLSAERLEREARRQAAMVALAAGLQAAGNSITAANAGYQSGYGSYNGIGTVHGAGGYARATTSGSYNYSGYNGAAAAQAQLAANAQNNAIFTRTEADIARIRANAQVGAFQRQTIGPHGLYSSVMTLEKIPSGTSQLHVIVRTGPDEHQFDWGYSTGFQ